MKNKELLFRGAALLAIGASIYIFLRTGSNLILIPAYVLVIGYIWFKIRNKIPFSWSRYALAGACMLGFAAYNYFSTDGVSTVGIIPAILLFAVAAAIYIYNKRKIKTQS